MTTAPRGEPRTPFLLAAAVWTVLVAAAVAALPLALAGRLPDPMATHWGASGASDRAMPIAAAAVRPACMWVVFALVSLGLAMRRRALNRAIVRAWTAAALAWCGVFFLGLQVVTVTANLGRARWQDASPVAWWIVPVVLAAFAAGLLARALARRGPDERPPAPAPRSDIALPPGRRTVWVSSVSAPLGLWLGIAALVAAVSLAAATLAGLSPTPWATSVVLAVVGLAGLALSTVSVKVGPEGLRVSFGPLRWPSRHVPLDRIERAWVEDRRPADVGGWGFRGLPGMATIMIRGGECLVVRYTSGGQLGISVDDAATGAALLNALVSAPRP
ncbi:DUF1648 domain-containing protein [Microbispora corallina]|uniref:DUF1648 domain-containing protein n=1 Tax=Microbispora corallina TaxID=83302 RepID=A0ABQ4FRC2_9ACTN|nr:hypothetical protein [Microbispora corallina]GIH37372.1 hypothetical protein Mco01_03720 [Microbispora corallina]